MDNLQDTIGSILSDPDAMAKIQELGKSLGLTGGNDNTAVPTPAPQEQAKTSTGSNIDLSALSGMLSGLNSLGSNNSVPLPDPNTLGAITKFLPLLSGMNQEDEATALLYALRPFLSGQKQKRLDDAGKMLRIMRVLPMIRSTGLF